MQNLDLMLTLLAHVYETLLLVSGEENGINISLTLYYEELVSLCNFIARVIFFPFSTFMFTYQLLMSMQLQTGKL